MIETLECRQLLSAALPDLTGSLTTLPPASYAIGGSAQKLFTAAITVKNRGTVKAGGVLTANLYASTDRVLDPLDILLGTAPLKAVSVTINPGKTAVLSFSKKLAATIHSGTFYLLARINPTNRIKESNTNNDLVVSSKTFKISNPALPTGLAGPTPTSPGTSTDTGALAANLIPTMNWNEVSGAASYNLYIRKAPYTAADQIYSTTGLTGSSFVLPSGHLQAGVKYLWYMATVDSHHATGLASAGLYFQTAAVPTALSPLTSDVRTVVVGHTELSRFHVTVAGATSGTAVEVDLVDSTGAFVSKQCDLADDGSGVNGDSRAGDGVYSGVSAVDFTAPGTDYFVARISDPLLTSSVQTASLAIPGIAAPTSAQMQADQDTAATNTQTAQQALTGGGTPQSALDAVNTALQSDPNVQPGSIQRTDTAIFWTTLDGVTEGVDTTFLQGGDTLGGGGDVAAAPAERGIQPLDTTAPTPDPTMNVLILSPFASSLSTWDPSSSIESMFANDGYTVTYHTNQGVTFGDFANLGQYDAIELFGHGALIPGQGEGFYTSIQPSAATSLANAWALLNSRIVVMDNYYVITPSYIDAYAGEMNGTIVLANACNSAYDSTMADAFLGNGAAAYLGYTHVVKAGFAAGKATDTWTTLLQTTNNTVDDIPGLFTAHDTNNPAAYFTMHGDLNATLPQADLLKNSQVYIRYDWPLTEKDLDTDTTFLGSSVGWDLANSSPYLHWSGDNTSTGGSESCTVDLYPSWQAGAWSLGTSITAGADWYTPSSGSGPASISIGLQNIATGEISHVVQMVIYPDQESTGAHTTVANIQVLLGGDPTNPSVKLVVS